MTFPTIRIEGAILSADILDTIAQGEGVGQTAENFGLARATKTKDEIARAWADALDYWRIFKRKLDATAGLGTTETRKFWAVPLLNLLGYDPTLQVKGEEVQGRNYVISHRDRGQFPIHIVGWRGKLDEKPQAANGPKLSPHGLVQEYINLTEHVYALVTNGSSLRLLRDGSRLIRLSFVEFDLERMMDEEIFADFAVLYRLLHASRMPATPDQTPESWIERYHQDALESGSRIRDGLSFYVKEAIERFANGLLQHPANTHLRDQITTGRLSADAYYQHLLRLIYRLLFLMVTEERNIIYDAEAIKTNPGHDGSALKRLKGIYDQYYSLARLRRLAEQRHVADGRFTDLWTSLLDTFRLFEDGAFGQSLGITPLGGRLFGVDALGPLHQCALDNRTLLECLLKLSLFKHPKTGQRIRVNYAALNVEEFGSVYEGLLELDAAIINNGLMPVFSFVKGEGRGRSGSHYTPEELVQPLIKHSLDYLIADRLAAPERFLPSPVLGEGPGVRSLRQQQALLSLKILDPACGSGHILLSAARRLATELAHVRTNEDQPNPVAYRTALRDVVRNCIYGVDKNPAAVELCKVALWLESHTPGEPLGFLDHRIRCGDSIVGLTHAADLKRGIADEAFKPLPRDDKGIASQLQKRNREEGKKFGQVAVPFNQTVAEGDVQEVQADYHTLNQMPEQTPEEVATKQAAFERMLLRTGYARAHALADAVVAPFFLPKNADTQNRILTDEPYREMLRGYAGWQTPATALAKAISSEKRFFHWFLEFPDAFSNSNASGFDCVLANPPFIAGRDLKDKVGEDAQLYIMSCFVPSEGRADYVAYFFRRASELLKDGGFLSMIATNSICQGDTRLTAITPLIENSHLIVHAVKSMNWPGNAKVAISLVTIWKGEIWPNKFYLNKVTVPKITSRFDKSDDVEENEAFRLKNNIGKAFQGTILYGEGFKIDKVTADAIIQQDCKYNDVIYPFISGDDLNDNVEQKPSEIVINFHDWSLEKCSQYPLCLDIVQNNVYPERKLKGDKKAQENWWLYLRNRSDSYARLQKQEYALSNAVVSKYPAFARNKTNIVFSNKNTVFILRKQEETVLHASLYSEWLYKYTTTLRTANTISFSISECFETFPFPPNLTAGQETELEATGEQYHEHRRQLMLGMQLGLTKTYNLFHSQPLRPATAGELALDDKLFEKLLGKEAAHLRKHINRTPEATLSFNEAVASIEQLRRLHVQMDTAVRNAYGWQDLELGHAFHEVDYLPENDRVRYTISPAARREVLKRLLLLNHKLYAEEQAEKAAQTALQADTKGRGAKVRGTAYPKSGEITSAVAEPASTYQTASSPEAQDLRILTMPLFAAAAQMVVREKSCVTLESSEGKTLRVAPVRNVTESYIGQFQVIKPDSTLAGLLLGRREGDTIEFATQTYKIKKVD